MRTWNRKLQSLQKSACSSFKCHDQTIYLIYSQCSGITLLFIFKYDFARSRWSVVAITIPSSLIREYILFSWYCFPSVILYTPGYIKFLIVCTGLRFYFATSFARYHSCFFHFLGFLPSSRIQKVIYFLRFDDSICCVLFDLSHFFAN